MAERWMGLDFESFARACLCWSLCGFVTAALIGVPMFASSFRVLGTEADGKAVVGFEKGGVGHIGLWVRRRPPWVK